MTLWRGPRRVRTRLTLWYVGVMLVVLALYAGGVYVVVSTSVSKTLDARLHDDFEWASDMLAQRSDGTILPYDETGEGDSPWLQVYSLDGRMLRYRTPEATRVPIPQTNSLASQADDQIKTIDAVSPRFRVLTGKSQIGGDAVVVQVARSENEMKQELNHLLFVLLLGFPVGVAAAGLGGYSLARRALAPVDLMAERARTITAERLQDRLPVDNPDDELGKLATVFNDTLTRLEFSFGQMRRFSSDASHELRTPLTALRSVGEVGLRGKRDPSAYREIIGSMLEEVDRLSNLVDRLLTLSRAENGEVDLNVESIDLVALAEEVATQLDVLAEEKQQLISVDHHGPVHCIGDPMVLRQALLNLVDNAIKYSPIGGQVVIQVGQSPAGAILEVRDTGPGVPEGLRERIFERFYRIDGSRSRENGGTGLGLSIAKWAVEVNGGRLTLEKTDGPGSTFRMTLPQTSSAPLRTVEAIAPSAGKLS